MTDTSPPSFAFRGKAEIKHLNIRKEGPDDDEKILAVDVKLVGKTDAAVCDYFDLGLRDFLMDESGIARNISLEPVGFTTEIPDALVEIGGLQFAGAKLGKFKVSPADGNEVTLQFSVSFQPSKDEVAILAEYVADKVDVVATPQPELFGADGVVVSRPSTDGLTDELLPDARRLVVSHQRASISFIQRQLQIGYNRAARILEALEAIGIVSAMNKDGARVVLADGVTA